MEIACAITAGGKAIRMGGKNKAFLLIDGERIIDRNLNILKTKFKNISIISNNPERFSNYTNHQIYQDYYTDIGPLAGLHTAIKNCEKQAVFLISSDMPFISPIIIDKLILEFQNTKPDSLIPKINEKIEPLFGIYNCRIINQLESFIEKKRSYALRDFLKEIGTQYLELENKNYNKKSFYNINTAKDLLGATEKHI